MRVVVHLREGNWMPQCFREQRRAGGGERSEEIGENRERYKRC